jgi:hypothetical protein
MNLTQFENGLAVADAPPTVETIDRLEELVTQRRRELVLEHNRRIQLSAFDDMYSGADWQASDKRVRLVSQIAQSEQRRARIKQEIVEVARLIAAEADNEEAVSI